MQRALLQPYKLCLGSPAYTRVCPGHLDGMWWMRGHQPSGSHWNGANSRMKRKAGKPRLEKENFYLVFYIFRTSETGP